MDNRGLTIGELLVIIIISLVVGLVFYAILVRKIDRLDQKLDAFISPATSPSPTFSPDLTISPTQFPTPTPSPTVSPGTGLLRGVVTFSGNPLINVEVPIRDAKNNRLVANLFTDSQGRFSISLAPSQYSVGPVKEPSSGATVNATLAAVRANQTTDITITFQSRPQ